MVNINTIKTNHPEITNDELANIIFPDAKKPIVSFYRVLKGDYILRADQIERLAERFDCTPGELFEEPFSSINDKGVDNQPDDLF